MYFKEPAEGEAPALGTLPAVIVGAACLLILVGTAFGPWLLEWAGKVALS